MRSKPEGPRRGTRLSAEHESAAGAPKKITSKPGIGATCALEHSAAVNSGPSPCKRWRSTMVLPPSRSSEERSHEDHHFYSDRLVRSCRHRSARERLRREELLRPAGASLLLTPKTGWGGVSHRQPDDPLKRRGTAMKVLVSVAVYGLLPIPPMGVSS